MVKEWKIREAEKIREMLEKNELIAVIDMERMPTREFKEIKKKLMDDFEFKFVKKSLLLKALEKSDREGIEKIKEILPNQIMLAFGKGDPFLAFKKLMSIETFRFGREGDIAEDDIIIPAGPTKIPAGPAISDFAKAKIPAGVE
ncbi:MAG: 50S ribosomal protein L10, partial [Candidatus Aenigmarchaeota archaeon ex4484_224]